MEAEDGKVKAQYLDYLRQYPAMPGGDGHRRARGCVARPGREVDADQVLGALKTESCSCRIPDLLSYPKQPMSESALHADETSLSSFITVRVGLALCRYWIQVVHDIEYGYGDPLRTKVGGPCVAALPMQAIPAAGVHFLILGCPQVSPEFSIRLMDESYADENRTIQKVLMHTVQPANTSACFSYLQRCMQHL